MLSSVWFMYLHQYIYTICERYMYQWCSNLCVSLEVFSNIVE